MLIFRAIISVGSRHHTAGMYELLVIRMRCFYHIIDLEQNENCSCRFVAKMLLKLIKVSLCKGITINGIKYRKTMRIRFTSHICLRRKFN